MLSPTSKKLAAAEQWIHETMDEDTAADYVTVDGEGAGLPQESMGPGSDELQLLQQRVHELEGLLASQTPTRKTTAGAPSPPSTTAPPRGVLFDQNAPLPTNQAQTLATLRQMAGPAPGRLGAHERAMREGKPEHFLETLHQEQGLEAIEAPEVEDGFQELELAVTDPMQRLMLLQMKQLQILAK